MGYPDKAVATYFGGKGAPGAYQTIINQIPACDVYVEPMLGGGAVYRNLQLPRLTVISDIDSGLIAKYNEAGHGSRDGVLLINEPYTRVIDMLDKKRPDGTVVFFDPPYLKASRKSQADVYKYEWSDDDHRNFLQYVKLLKFNVIISHYPCDFYDGWLLGWRTVDYKSMTRHGLADERLYMNYPEPTFLQDTRYVGNDFIERQRVKRKAQRWLANVAKMTNAERQAVLAAIIDKYT